MNDIYDYCHCIKQNKTCFGDIDCYCGFDSLESVSKFAKAYEEKIDHKHQRSTLRTYKYFPNFLKGLHLKFQSSPKISIISVDFQRKLPLVEKLEVKEKRHDIVDFQKKLPLVDQGLPLVDQGLPLVDKDDGDLVKKNE